MVALLKLTAFQQLDFDEFAGSASRADAFWLLRAGVQWYASQPQTGSKTAGQAMLGSSAKQLS